MRIMIQPKGRPYIMVRLGPAWIYAEKNGGLVRKDETSWKKISGILVNTKKGCFWFEFRRIWKWK